MDIVDGIRLEIILETPNEPDHILGNFVGWCEFGSYEYLVIRRDDGNLTYVSPETIRAIHTYGGASGAE